MKILKVAFENINSLKGFHEIDFSREPFLTNSLFAITGPTGSGKSSILDVISLALFNHVPRLGKITRNEIQTKGAILTRNQKNAMARVTYECKNGIYSSQWSIEVNRNNNLNDYEMEIHDHQTGKLIDLKKSVVPSKNEELIGLNYDQFIKAVLLAQGEFAQFLKAKKDERGELLEKITGTGIYRRLGIRAFEKNREANRDIQDQQNEIQIIERDILEDEVVVKHQANLKEKSVLCEDYRKETEKLKKSIQLKQDIEDQKKEIQKQKASEATGIEDLKKFDLEHGSSLKQHEKVQNKADELREWKQLKKQVSDFQEQKKKISELKRANQQQIGQLLTDVSELTKSSVKAETISEELNDFRDKVLKLIEARKDKLSSYSAKKDQLQSELRDTGFGFDEQDIEGSIHDFELALSRIREKSKQYREELQLENSHHLGEVQQGLRTRIRSARDASRIFSGISQRKIEITRIEEELQQENSKLEFLPAKIKEATSNSRNLQQQLENLKLQKENARLKASLEEHRKNLKDGEACPLCGATHHPYAHEVTTQTDTIDEKLQELENKSEASNRELHRLEAEHTNLQKRLIELHKKLAALQEQYQKSRKGFSEDFSEFKAVTKQEEIDLAVERLESKLEILLEFERSRKTEQSLANAIPLAREIKNIITEGRELKKQLDMVYSGKNIQNDVQQYSNKWNRIQQEALNLRERASETDKQLLQLNQSLEKLETELNPFISESGFSNIQDAWQVLMPEAEASKLRNERQQILRQIDNSKASLKLLNEQLLKLRDLDTDTEKEKLFETLQSKNEKLTGLNNECKELERILKNQEDRVKRMTSLRLQIQEKEKQTKRWRLLNELIGDSKGKQFNDFAQDLTLSRLLKLANIRLQDLNDRYLIDKPEPEEDDGLVAIDEHMGGQRRSVKTLSGGETFILSLSMALALSDLASKNVEINSLFIDEGFGTLDPETLDQTLDTLEKLQAESSKTIGVISHVDSLKERISTQIKLTRNGQGYSSLEISS
ncbi:AAA family ATPase [Gramella sp. GC03-9]|uniref:AAA family ATPase n=1 Tax=Christiangramia oceanisediminis TaxID=2920386 RepID=A0A9X2KZ35_9FLAO|nr:AAA family ATPase [Gramella oceanisediminis]MCP9200869.1 AAA family ATPase [Gramella oceanisediminis]